MNDNIPPEKAVDEIIMVSKTVVQKINDFTKTVFRTRGGRTGSGMGLLLEGLWGFYVNQLLAKQPAPYNNIEIAWITHHEYNDFACVYRDQPWDSETRSGEILRIEQKSMLVSADESKAHFNALANSFSPNDLLVILAWNWVKLDSFRFFPRVLDQFIGRASDIAQLRDALHLQRGGSFVSRASCPDGCYPDSCSHHGEPLNANGKRERKTGPDKCKPARISHAANFGGLVRMLNTRGAEAKKEFQKLGRENPAARDYISFIQQNFPKKKRRTKASSGF